MAVKKLTKPAKKTAPRARGDKLDWVAIRQEYVTSSISLSALAQKHNAHPSSLDHRCAAEKWIEARAEFVQDLHRRTQERIAVEWAADKAKGYERLGVAEDMLYDQIEGGVLTANSSEAANKSLIEILKAKAALAGDPITEKREVSVTGDLNVTHHGLEDMTYDELVRHRASLAAGLRERAGEAGSGDDAPKG